MIPFFYFSGSVESVSIAASPMIKYLPNTRYRKEIYRDALFYLHSDPFYFQINKQKLKEVD
jgi:hypothetical protein